MKKQILIDDLEQLETKEYTKFTPILVPESFADLLTLCKDLKDVDIEEADDLDVARIIIHNADLIYFEDEILMVAGFKKLEIKPEKMWNIIKSLIGEQNGNDFKRIKRRGRENII